MMSVGAGISLERMRSQSLCCSHRSAVRPTSFVSLCLLYVPDIRMNEASRTEQQGPHQSPALCHGVGLCYSIPVLGSIN
jgi:hypothetical protein